MKTVPKLLNDNGSVVLSRELFSDLQLDKILSAQAISVLQKPCGENEILRRNEVFALLEKAENLKRTETVLDILSAAERSLLLLKDAIIPLDRYHRYAEAFESYLSSCESLVSMHDLGSLFADAADYFLSEEKKCILSDMKAAVQKIKTLLAQMHEGLLSFADKNWLTPNDEAVSEYDRAAGYAESLGFAAPGKKLHNVKVNRSLSDAICSLYADKIAELEAEIGKFSDVDMYEPTVYIPELKFFLEIHSLIEKGDQIGVPHCIAKVADGPRYTADSLSDISLFAKNCEKIVPNDADFTESEAFYFLLGANGGGKTTYLRAVCSNLVLFLAGCPVFAKNAEIYPFDTVLSHFPKDERFDNTGRLDEERMRTGEMLKTAQNKAAFLFFNETFSGTDDKRGLALATDVVAQIGECKHFGLYVTHFHEVMAFDYPVLSAEVDPADENKRTFRIVRAKGSTSSYAADILKKYGLDKDSLAKRRCRHGN